MRFAALVSTLLTESAYLPDKVTLYHGTSKVKARAFLEDGMSRPKGKIKAYLQQRGLEIVSTFLPGEDPSRYQEVIDDAVKDYLSTIRKQSKVGAGESYIYTCILPAGTEAYALKAGRTGSEAWGALIQRIGFALERLRKNLAMSVSDAKQRYPEEDSGGVILRIETSWEGVSAPLLVEKVRTEGEPEAEASSVRSLRDVVQFFYNRFPEGPPYSEMYEVIYGAIQSKRALDFIDNQYFECLISRDVPAHEISVWKEV